MNQTLRRIFLGQKYESADVQRKLRTLEWLFVSLTLASIVSVIASVMMSGYAFYLSGMLLDRNTAQPEIDLSNLTAEEAMIATRLLAELDPLYLTGHERIVFVYDVEASYGQVSGRKYDKDGFILLGFNHKGQVYVGFSEDQTQMRKTLCHELLHTYAKGGETAHDIIYDLEDKDVCYT